MQADFPGGRVGDAVADGGDVGVEGIERDDGVAVGAGQHQGGQEPVAVGGAQGIGGVDEAFVRHQRTLSMAIRAAATARSSASSTL